jgi:5-methylcytosine-specific restriction endonuclease McrA
MPSKPPGLRAGFTSSRRRSTTRWGKLYGSQRWRKASKRFLARPENALCRPCRERGLVVASEATDHIVDHCGDPVLFWSEDNWQPICWSCHSSKTRTGEPPRRKGCDARGVPLDPSHPWHRDRA